MAAEEANLLEMKAEAEETDEDVELLSREELISKVRDLTAVNYKLQNQVYSLSKALQSKGKKNKQRPYDFARFKQRHVALRIAYLGWTYQGLAIQENTKNTIEEELFSALTKARLIQDRASCKYSRCGRTDKGVSALGQVISLYMRSNLQHGLGILDEETNVDGNIEKKEVDYVRLLNKMLPPDIRVLAWVPIDHDFDARFSCKTRTYRYFFPAADLDIETMHKAAQRLLGEHDFRNFCKVDVGNNVNHFIRRINSFEVKRLSGGSNSPYDICEMVVCGLAFLWHQVRCMVSVLFLIGLHLEKPQIIDNLLNVETCPRKPQYTMASEIPLILFDCDYEGINWIYEEDNQKQNICHFQRLWTDHSVRIAMIKRILDNITSTFQTSNNDSSQSMELIYPLMTGHRRTQYKPLLDRPVCEGFDKHMERQAIKRRKLEEKYREESDTRQMDEQSQTETT